MGNTDRALRSKYDGATKASHFDDAVKAVDYELSDEDTAYLEEAYVAHEVVGALSGNVKKTW